MDPRVTELHNIMPIANIGSILKHGLLSHERAAKLVEKGTSVALSEVQDRRDKTQVPLGLKLHRYANLYFHARNPMMYLRRDQAEQMCVLRVSTEVLAITGCVLSDRNAAAEWARFLAPAQWVELSFDDIFARDWRDSDSTAYLRKKSRKCAEVLVPHAVPFKYLQGAYVVNDATAGRLTNAGFKLPIAVNPDLFFH